MVCAWCRVSSCGVCLVQGVQLWCVVGASCGVCLVQGVQLLLDGVVDYLPNPAEVVNHALDESGPEPVKVVLDPRRDASLPFLGLAYKLESGRYGQLTFVRVYRGNLKRGDQVRPSSSQAQRPGMSFLISSAETRYVLPCISVLKCMFFKSQVLRPDTLLALLNAHYKQSVGSKCEINWGVAG